MSTDNILSVPIQPLWATDPGAAVEPDGVDKTPGWPEGFQPVAPWQNWLQLQIYGWTRGIIGRILSDWRRGNVDHGAALVELLVYHPSPGNGEPGFLGGEAALLRTSPDGRTWSFSNSNSGISMTPGAVAIDTDNVLIGDSAGTIHYAPSIEHSDWLAPSSDATGIPGGSILTIYTKFESGSDFTMIGGLVGAIRIKVDGVSGGSAWQSPTTPPATTAAIASILYLGGTTWLALDIAGESFRSTDDGDHWIAAATIPNLDFSSFAARCPQTGRIVWLQNGLKMFYSGDNGASWTEGVLQPGTAPVSGQWTAIKAVGAGAFILCAGADGNNNGQTWFTTDGGQTTRRVYMGDSPESVLFAVETDGQKLAAMGEGAFATTPTYHTACFDSSGIPDIP